jgi:hypothetical protein
VPVGGARVTAVPEPSRPNLPVMRVGGRIVTASSYRSTEFPDLADTVAWWTSATLLAGLIAIAGVLTFFEFGTLLAVVGVILFLAAAVAVGAGRFELSTAIAGAGFLWITAGIGVSIGPLAHEIWVPVGFVVVGLVFTVVAARRAIMASRR